MISYLVLGLVLLFCLYALLCWFVEVEPKAVLRVLKWLVLVLVILLFGWLALTGKLALAFAVLPALFVWFGRFRTIFNIGRLQGVCLANKRDVQAPADKHHKSIRSCCV